MFELTGLEVSEAGLDLSTTAFDLSLNIEEFEEGIFGRLRYNTDLFKAETIRRMAGHYLTLLESIVEDVERSIALLTLLSSAERRLLLEEWNDTKRESATEAY